jgi:hypothetical protein
MGLAAGSRRAIRETVCAAASRSLECLRLLVEEGGARAGNKAVKSAISWGRLDCLAYLVECPQQAVGSRQQPALRISWRRAFLHATSCGELECLRYLCERARREGRDLRANGGVLCAGACCLSALRCWREDCAWPARGVSCLRYVVACSGVSARVVAESAAGTDTRAAHLFGAWLVCRRMHACATALKRAWRARRAARFAAASTIADAWLRHHYAPGGRGYASARTRFGRGKSTQANPCGH